MRLLHGCTVRFDESGMDKETKDALEWLEELMTDLRDERQDARVEDRLDRVTKANIALEHAKHIRNILRAKK